MSSLPVAPPEISAGPELDAAVAKSVMGYEVLEVGYLGTEEETPRMRELSDWMDKVGLESVGVYQIDVQKDYCEELQPYSADIAAAWTVVKKCSDASTLFSIVVTPTWAYAGLKRHGVIIAADQANTAPLAICRTALKAMESEAG